MKSRVQVINLKLSYIGREELDLSGSYKEKE